MKWILPLLLCSACLLLSGCDDCSQNYTGYEAAWNGEGTPSWFSGKEYREGYEQGIADSDTYDLGYDDGYEGKGPKYSRDSLYMDGFKDGENDKRRGF